MPYRGHSAPCPSCRAPLRDSTLVSGHTVTTCNSCDGLLIKEASLRHLVTQLVTEPDHVLCLGARQRSAPRECPACGVAMEELSCAGVDVDRCPAHGLWLDRAELSAVLAGHERLGTESFKCPRCAKAMCKRATALGDVLTCHACKSDWVDHRTIDDVVFGKPFIDIGTEFKVDGRRLECPKCMRPLVKKRLGSLDVAVCQLWPMHPICGYLFSPVSFETAVAPYTR